MEHDSTSGIPLPTTHEELLNSWVTAQATIINAWGHHGPRLAQLDRIAVGVADRLGIPYKRRYEAAEADERRAASKRVAQPTPNEIIGVVSAERDYFRRVAVRLASDIPAEERRQLVDDLLGVEW